MSDKPPPGAAPGGLGDLLSRILGYIDRPWKALAVAFLGLLAGGGFLVWESRARLADLLLAPALPQLALAELPVRLAELRSQTGADLIMVWEADFPDNAQRFRGAILGDGRAWSPKDYGLSNRLPIFTAHTQGADVIAAMHGSILCDDPANRAGAVLLTRLAAEGMSWICVIPTPPAHGLALAGLYLAWRQKPGDAALNADLEAGREAADEMVKR